MTGPGVSCEVYVAGNRVADTAEDYLAGAPTALTDLAVLWGRSTVVDQPAASSCSLTVADRDGDLDFLDLLHVGRTLDVYGSGQPGYARPTDIAVDGALSSPPAGRVWTPDAAAATAASGYTVTAAGITAHVWIPPAPWSLDPASWAALPNPSQAEQWTVRLTVTPAMALVIASWDGAYFTGPTAGPGVPAGHPAAVPASGAAAATWTIPDDSTDLDWVGGLLTVTVPAWTAVPGSWAAQTASWAQCGQARIGGLQVIAPAAARRRILMFSGRITDLDAHAADAGLLIDVTGSDWSVDLANDNIGGNPWPAEPISTRTGRILALASTPVAADVDPGVGARVVSWIDVDSQPVYGLLADLATSADAILWPAAQAVRGFYLWFEDPLARSSLGVLVWDPGRALVVVSGNTRPAGSIVLSACLIGQDGLHWLQDVSDVLTRVDLSWQEQTLDDQGHPAPTERHTITVDDQAQRDYGVRSASYSTLLTTEPDALQIASRVLARSDQLGWRATGMSWDTRTPAVFTDADRSNVLTLLDAARRIGLPVIFTDMPAWSLTGPTLPAYLEGGRYLFHDGRWQLDLTVSPSGLSGYSATWRDLDPAWQWRQFDPDIAWQDCWGLTAVSASPRWGSLDRHPWTADTHSWAGYWGTHTTMMEAA